MHVSPGGSDAGDGSAAAPFATLVRAQRAARASPGRDVVVSLGAGGYYLPEPLVFTSADGGSAERSVTSPGRRERFRDFSRFFAIFSRFFRDFSLALALRSRSLRSRSLAHRASRKIQVCKMTKIAKNTGVQRLKLLKYR